MMLICIKQHLSKNWSSIHEKVENTETELKKNVAYKKGMYLLLPQCNLRKRPTECFQQEEARLKELKVFSETKYS